MKKLLAIILTTILVLAFPFELVCAEPVSQQTVEFFDDGSYLVTTITYEPSILRASTRSGSATSTYYDIFGTRQFDITVTATFTYDQTAAKATSARSSYRIYNSEWSCNDSLAYYSGDTATALGTFKKGSSSKDIEVTLTCSPSGELS